MASGILVMESDGDRMTFLEFCNKIANPDTTPIVAQDTLSMEKMNEINHVINGIRYQLSRADSVKLTFIQNAFEDMDKVVNILESKYNGEVNDNIALYLSRNLYGSEYDQLGYEKAIIKVLTVYLMIQPHLNA